ncbi:hypothetical protein BRD00_02830 [Halobacteriales archaeon QS_8_69_26]|nr:MAG: hypothetical protein BRD00_02830 [Halobacteriales archaeon QS_8_69_26]
MSQDQDSLNSEGELSQFEKNKYFHGKLMTARDMQTEQQYHAERLHTLNRFAIGRGILYGVEISEVEEVDDELEVTLEPGVVIDGYGRPIVIEHTTTKTLPSPSGDEIYLFLRYNETELESVPVPEVRGASDSEYMSNRTVEAFELTYQESPPEEYDEISEVDTDIADAGDDDKTLRALANRFHQRHRTPVEPVDDPSIFIGAFERTRDGSWVKGGETVRRNLVYDNDMLYAALIQHITDTENPHNFTGGAGGVGGDMEEVESIQRQVRTLTDQLDTVTSYLMRKSLKDKIRFFDDVSARFDTHEPDASRISQEIVEKAKDGIRQGVHEDDEEFADHVGEMLQLDINLGEALDEAATEESLERYVKAVNRLQETLVGETDPIRIAEAQDAVCEAADSLEVLYDIVPE